nr:M20/M25/M40 family metallo-hydrolase [Odoribacter sp.]
SETEGELYVGCAGGIDASAAFKYKEEKLPDGVKAFRLAVKGLKGGHSGMDINLGRGNSNKLLFRFLKTYAQDLQLRLSTVSGGSLRNAIPRESFAVVVLPAGNASRLQAAVKEAESVYRAELIAKEPDLQVMAEETALPAFVIDACTQSRLTNSILACPNGAVRMIDSMPDTVETSNNLAIVQSEEGKIVIKTLLRSSVETAKEALAQTLRAVFELAAADEITFEGGYPGWKPNPDSAILKEMQELYEQLYGKKPAIMAIHAGLECGILGSKYPNWDMISFGPTICSPHSPDERVNIASVGKFWDYLKATLKNVPVK